MLGLPLILALIALTAVRGLRVPGAFLALVLARLGLDQVARASSSLFVGRSWVIDLLVGTLALIGLLWAILSGRFRLRFGLHPVVLATGGFFLLYFWSSQWGYSGPIYRTLVTDGFAATLALNLVIAPLLLGSVSDARAGARYSRLLCASLSIYILANPSIWAEHSRRLELAFVGSPDTTSNALALADIGGIAFMLSVLAPHFTRWSGWKSVAVYASGIAGLLVTASASRGETAAAVVAGLMVLSLTSLDRFSARPRLVGILAIVILGSATTAIIADMGMASRYQPEMLRSGLEIRVSLSEQVLDRYVASPEHWLLGLGAGTSYRLLGSYPHNQLVQALVESGIVGALLWLIAPIAAAVALVRGWRYARDDSESRFAFSSLAVLLIYSVILTFKRGAVLETGMFMHALLAERFVLALRERAHVRALPQAPAEPARPLSYAARRRRDPPRPRTVRHAPVDSGER